MNHREVDKLRKLESFTCTVCNVTMNLNSKYKHMKSIQHIENCKKCDNIPDDTFERVLNQKEVVKLLKRFCAHPRLIKIYERWVTFHTKAMDDHYKTILEDNTNYHWGGSKTSWKIKNNFTDQDTAQSADFISAAMCYAMWIDICRRRSKCTCKDGSPLFPPDRIQAIFETPIDQPNKKRYNYIGYPFNHPKAIKIWKDWHLGIDTRPRSEMINDIQIIEWMYREVNNKHNLSHWGISWKGKNMEELLEYKEKCLKGEEYGIWTKNYKSEFDYGDDSD